MSEPAQDNQQGGLERDAYLAERRSLADSEKEQSVLYDRTVVTITGAALGLSMAFITDVVPDYGRETLIWLGLGWTTLIIGLLATLVSLQTSQTAHQRQRAILDATWKSAESGATHRNCAATATMMLNWISLAAMVVGVVFLALFVFVNL